MLEIKPMAADKMQNGPESNPETQPLQGRVPPGSALPSVTRIQNVRARGLSVRRPAVHSPERHVNPAERPAGGNEPPPPSHFEAQPSSASPDFFERNVEPRREIIEGLLREGQIMAIGSPYGVGKSPLLQDLTVCRIGGIPWCGRRVEQGPVILFDFESSGPAYRKGIRNICSRYNVPMPKVPQELDAYLFNDDATSPPTARLLNAVATYIIAERIALLEAALASKPNALIVIDPSEMLFRIDTGKKVMILALYKELRLLISKFPTAAFLLVFNMRKKDRKSQSSPNLLSEPRDWLEDVCGTLDIMNRSDVRLGMDFHGEDVRVINGVRRSEDMHPLMVREVGNAPDTLAGFELCPPEQLALKFSFTPALLTHWLALPLEFKFEQIAGVTVPRASLYRLLQRAKSLGVIEERNGVWRKMARADVLS